MDAGARKIETEFCINFAIRIQHSNWHKVNIYPSQRTEENKRKRNKFPNYYYMNGFYHLNNVCIHMGVLKRKMLQFKWKILRMTVGLAFIIWEIRIKHGKKIGRLYLLLKLVRSNCIKFISVLCSFRFGYKFVCGRLFFGVLVRWYFYSSKSSSAKKSRRKNARKK